MIEALDEHALENCRDYDRGNALSELLPYMIRTIYASTGIESQTANEERAMNSIGIIVGHHNT
jgi:hypothetical protein